MQAAFDKVERSAAWLSTQLEKKQLPKLGIVFGSGLGLAAEALMPEPIWAKPFADIEGFLRPKVEGHSGKLLAGSIHDVPTLISMGRVHAYEGHAISDVVHCVRTMVSMGAKTLIITNAAGGINETLVVGDIMEITDHLNLTGRNPLIGENQDAWGPRFPDMTDAYDNKLRRLLRQTYDDVDTLRHVQGVYAGLMGPNYETPAEIQMLRALGADAVGMSTVLEVIAAHQMGARIVGLSCISNAAAGMTGEPLSHAEVKAAGNMVWENLSLLINGFVEKAHTKGVFDSR